MSSWIESLMEETDGVETPISYKYFSFLTCISAAAGNNYYMSLLQGKLVVKPNIYVILLGPSGLGKEFPIWLATELVQRSETTRVIAGRSSIQGIVKELATARTSQNGKAPIMDSRAFIVNGELSTALIQDPDSLTILTDLYDRKSRWANLLKGEGEVVLKNPYVSCLFGSSPAHFRESIPQVNVEGGYIGRNFIVKEEKLAKQVDLFSKDEEDDKNPNANDFPFQKYVQFLETLHKGGGRIIPDSDAKTYFNDWRRKWRENQSLDETGFVARVPVHVLKVAMCMLLSDYEASKTLVLTQEHIEEAIYQVTKLVYSVKATTDGKGLDPLSAQTKLVLDYLINAEGNCLTRKQLLVKGYGNFSSQSLDQILENLKEIEWIRRDRIFAGKNSDWQIHLHGKPLQQYVEFLEKAKAQRMRKSLVKDGV